MRGKITKKLAIGAIGSVVIVAVYLVFPPLTMFSASKVRSESQRINSSTACKADTIYATESTRDTHEKEGYAFVVDDRCAKLQEKLVAAIQNDDLNTVAHLIAEGANPLTADWSSFQPVFPLHVAVYKSPALVKLLLDNGADVNYEYCCCAACASPLTTAIYEKRIQTIRLLLERGANVEYRPRFTDGEPYSPLELAAQSGDSEIFNLVANACEQNLSCRIKSRIQRIRRLIRF